MSYYLRTNKVISAAAFIRCHEVRDTRLTSTSDQPIARTGRDKR